MKTALVLVTFILGISVACNQNTNEKTGTVTVIDARNNSVLHDTSTAGHKENEVLVKRIMTGGMPGIDAKTSNGYEIHFFRPFEGALYHYYLTALTDSAYDKASYEWKADSSVEVTLIKSLSNDKKQFTLLQPATKGGSAAIIIDPDK